MATDSLTFRPYLPGDETKIAGLFRCCFDRRLDLDLWSWRFRQNPAGPSVILLAWDEETLVSHYAVTPVIRTINGKERLTCITKIKDLKGNVVTLTPLEHFKPLGDLVVDMTSFYDGYDEEWSYLTLVEKEGATPTSTHKDRYQRFENCIECGACISACPITPQNKGFLGPAVLAAANNELKKAPQKAGDLLALAGGRNGEKLCERALNCSRVCPTGVYPARHIADLRRRLGRTVNNAKSDKNR